MAEERTANFADGLHFVGLWHTHPEPIPVPSELDRQLAADHAAAAADLLTGIVFVIVGNVGGVEGVRVWIQEARSKHPSGRARLLQLRRTDSPRSE